MGLAGVPRPWLQELGLPSRLQASLDPRQPAWGRSFSVGQRGWSVRSEVSAPSLGLLGPLGFTLSLGGSITSQLAPGLVRRRCP